LFNIGRVNPLGFSAFFFRIENLNGDLYDSDLLIKAFEPIVDRHQAFIGMGSGPTKRYMFFMAEDCTSNVATFFLCYALIVEVSYVADEFPTVACT
jgi:hypothetical protein